MNNEDKTNVLAGLGAIAGVALLLLYGVTLGGYIAQCYWNWFLIKVISVEPLSFHQGMCLAAFLSCIRGTRQSDKYFVNGKEVEKKTNWAYTVISPLIFLLFGWIIHLFI